MKPKTEFPRFFFINQIVLKKKTNSSQPSYFWDDSGQQDMGDHFYLLTRNNDILNKKSECNQFLNWGKYWIEKLEAICWKCTFRTQDNISFKNLLYNQICDLENSIWCNFAQFCLQLLTLNSLINEHDCLAFLEF